jgi:apolipoprotein D and lipocalin family protein
MRLSRLAPVVLIAGGLAAIAATVAAGSSAQSPPPVRPVATVDLDRYLGRWYEIARFPNRFQKKCTGNVVVYYSKRDDGRIGVRNTCGTTDGAIEANGVARRADEDGPSSILEVRFAPAILSFIPAVWGDYWILGLAPDYSTAVVGSPDREYLWFLARTPEVDQATWARMVEDARSQGFDVDRLARTKQEAFE